MYNKKEGLTEEFVDLLEDYFKDEWSECIDTTTNLKDIEFSGEIISNVGSLGGYPNQLHFNHIEDCDMPDLSVHATSVIDSVLHSVYLSGYNSHATCSRMNLLSADNCAIISCFFNNCWLDRCNVSFFWDNNSFYHFLYMKKMVQLLNMKHCMIVIDLDEFLYDVDRGDIDKPYNINEPCHHWMNREIVEEYQDEYDESRELQEHLRDRHIEIVFEHMVECVQNMTKEGMKGEGKFVLIHRDEHDPIKSFIKFGTNLIQLVDAH